MALVPVETLELWMKFRMLNKVPQRERVALSHDLLTHNEAFIDVKDSYPHLESLSKVDVEGYSSHGVPRVHILFTV